MGVIYKDVLFYMKSFVQYLISGAASPTTGTLPCEGTDNFTVGIYGASVGAIPPTGTVNINARADESVPYITLSTVNFSGSASGTTLQLSGPWSSVQATANPVLKGTFTVVTRYSASVKG